jgi:zinc protease
MKSLLSMAVLASLACATTPATPATSSSSPTKAPAAAEPAKSSQATAAQGPVTEGNVTFGTVGRMQVLVQRMPGAELLTSALAIRGGSQSLDARTAGVELLGLRTAASGGSETLDKEAFSRRLTKLGSTFEAIATPDYSVLRAKSLRASWEQTFELLTDVFLHPGLPGAEFELQRQRQVQELRQEREGPDGALRHLSQRMLFAGTPYANRPVGTEESVKALTLEQVRAHLARLRTQEHLLLVVVGDVDPEAVFAKAQKALGALPAGEPLPQPPAPLSFASARIEVETRPLPTNYILASFAAPGWQSPDFAAARLAASVINAREFIEVRTKRNLSYAAGAGLDVSRPQSFGALYVSAVDPSAALPVMQDVVRSLATQPLSDKELAGYRSTFLTGFLEGQEATDDVATRLVAAQLLGGDWRLVRTLPERIRQTTPVELQAFAQKYARNYQVAVVGDPKKVDLSMLH